MIDSPQRIAILGAGRSGLAAALLARQKGVAGGSSQGRTTAEVTVFDTGDTAQLASKLAALDAAGIPHVTGEAARHLVVASGDFDLVIISPGIDASWPLPQKFTRVGIPLTGETEYAFQFCSTPLIAITGTNGKTTTTELCATILNACGLRSVPCGNHGMPLSEVLVSGQEYDVLSLEVSSFQLETIRTFRARVSLWLNFDDDHLDRYPDRQAYFEAKSRIFMNVRADDTAIVLQGEPVASGPARRLTFSAFGLPADYTFADGVFAFQGEAFGTHEGLRLLGRHNMENVLAALAACAEFGVPPAAGLEALKTYGVPKHRCELVRDFEGRRYVNDSKATNVHAAVACIRSFDEPVVLIAGGLDKHLDYTPLLAAAPGRVRAMITIGTIAESLCRLFGDLLPCETAPDLPTAVRRAHAVSQPGDVVVLSPTTSSFDMFSGYPERGEVFRRAVMALN